MAPNGLRVIVEISSAKANVLARLSVTTTAASAVRASAAAGANVAPATWNAVVCCRSTTLSGCHPKASRPVTSDATHTTTTAPADRPAATAALEASSRGRDIGRARR